MSEPADDLDGAALEPPLVGVVMPARDAEEWIEASLGSLQAQTMARWVCVVVDDGSLDRTRSIVQTVADADARVVLLRQPGRGVAAARNAGLDALPPGCPYVGFLDSDDLYLPGALAGLVAALERRPDAAAAFGLADYIDEAGRLLNPGLHPSRQRWHRQLRSGRLVLQEAEEDVTFDSLVVDDPVWPAAVALHRTEAVSRAGGFDVSFPLLEDWELHLRVARQGPYVATDQHVALYRRHSSNLTARHHDAEFHRARVRRLAWSADEAPPDERAAVARAWRLLERRQVLVLGQHVVRSLSRRRWRSAQRASVGLVVAGVTSLHLRPPAASRRRTRLTRPDDLLGTPL